MGFGDSATRQRFPAGVDAVWAATIRACSRLGRVDQRDDYLKRLVLVTGMSGFSWGERVTVQVAPVDDATSELSLESSLRLGVNVMGAGRNRRNIDDVIANVSYFLQRGNAGPDEGWQSSGGGLVLALRFVLGLAIAAAVAYVLLTQR